MEVSLFRMGKMTRKRPQLNMESSIAQYSLPFLLARPAWGVDSSRGPQHEMILLIDFDRLVWFRRN